MASGNIPMGIPQWIYVEDSSSSNSNLSYPYTVSGNGYVIVNAYIRSDTTSDSGTAIAQISHTNTTDTYARAWCMTRIQTAQGIEIGTNASAAFKVENGDTVEPILSCNKNGTKRVRYSIMAFGCTLTAQS